MMRLCFTILLFLSLVLCASAQVSPASQNRWLQDANAGAVASAELTLPDAPSATEHKPDEATRPGSGLQYTGIEPPTFRIQPRPAVVREKTIDRPFIILQALQLAAMIGDVESTRYGLSHGGREGNPLVGSHPSRAVLYGISLPVTAGLTYWSYHLKKAAPHSRRWQIVPLVTMGIHGVAAVHNLATVRSR